MEILFIYGKLKRDCIVTSFPSDVMPLDNSVMVGTGETVDRFTLYNISGFPVATEKPTHKIKGEVYFVSEDILKEVDIVEGVPELFIRTKAKVQVFNKTKLANVILDAHIYVANLSIAEKLDEEAKTRIIKSGEW